MLLFHVKDIQKQFVISKACPVRKKTYIHFYKHSTDRKKFLKNNKNKAQIHEMNEFKIAETD